MEMYWRALAEVNIIRTRRKEIGDPTSISSVYIIHIRV